MTGYESKRAAAQDKITDEQGRPMTYWGGKTQPAQRPLVELTDTEIDAEANSILTSDPVQWWRRLARAVLAKSKEMNNAA